MEDVVLYQTTNPTVRVELADLIFKFEGMQLVGYSMKDIQKYLTKEELTALVFWYAEKAAQKAQNTEGVSSVAKNYLFTDFENVQ